jgi:hypothetical protein
MKASDIVTRDCKLGLKSYQNILASYKYLEYMCGLQDSKDFILLSSIFQTAIVRYAKPFLNNQTEFGKIKYPIKHLRDIPGFKQELHEHLLDLRNKFVAHDDYNEIDTRLLKFGFRYNNYPVFIPTSIAISNKQISHPADIQTVLGLKEHIAAVLDGVGRKLNDDVGKLRKIIIDNPEEAIESSKYTNDYGSVAINADGTIPPPPDFTDDEWLNTDEPDFSHIDKGYRYEDIRYKNDFMEPIEVPLSENLKFRYDPKGKI